MTPEERAAYMKRYYAENKEYLLKYRKAWYRRNCERISMRRRKRYLTDPEFRRYEIERHKAKKITKPPVERTEPNE